MQLVSTRDSKTVVSFRNAILNSVPSDGGLYVPAGEQDLRPWIMYMDENTSFSSIAGTLTAALLKEEFSPVVTERIAAKAFEGYSPVLRQLDERLHVLELFHGPTGSHKDFGLAWLASAMEHILTMEDRTAVVIAATAGVTGRSMAAAFAGKKRLKTILVYAKGTLVGLKEEYLSRNGGNILPVEVDGNLQDALALVRSMYADPAVVSRYGLTLANTMNIGRLLPQVFFYMYAFSRLRKNLGGDIFYAVPSGNFGNLVAGLYAWKFSLPVNGFITEATAALNCNAAGHCVCMDSIIPLSQRGPADPSLPSNLERLEQVFAVNPAMLSGLIFPAPVDPHSIRELQYRAWQKYGVLLDTSTATAYGAVEEVHDRVSPDEGTVVLLAKDHPSFESEKLQIACGRTPEMPERMADSHSVLTGFDRMPLDQKALEKLLSGFVDNNH